MTALVPGPEEIGFQFCAFSSIAGRLIDWGTEGDCGHVDIILPAGHERAGDLLGAQHEDDLGGTPSGVQIRPVGYVKATGGYNLKRAILKTTPETAASAYAWALAMVGSPYDTKAIEGIALGEDWSTEGHFICSGLATGTLTQPMNAFYRRSLPRNWRVMTPEQLLIFCSAYAEIIAVD